jgi:hypothetical protein
MAWMIGVMVEVAGEPRPLRHFFAVGCEDRARAEWTAIDKALLIGRVSVSPVDGYEPVQAVGELAARSVKAFALRPDEVRPLGWTQPRRWQLV